MITQAKFYIHHFQSLTNSTNAYSYIVQKRSLPLPYLDKRKMFSNCKINFETDAFLRT